MAPLKEHIATKTQQRSASDLWGPAPYAVIVVDRTGTVRDLNPAAASLLGGVTPGVALSDAAPSWLARAHEETTNPTGRPGGDAHAAFRGRIGARSFEAHPAPYGDGEVVWWLADDTDRRLVEEELATERERTAFLAEASNVLLASLNTDRCMLVTAQLASRYLAEAAIVIVPAAGRKLPMTYAVEGGAAVRRTVIADTALVPGLSEALQGFPPVPSRWIDPAFLPDWLIPEGFGGTVGSAAVTPLPGHGVPAGVLVLLRGTDSTEFNENEEIFARLFAARAGAALSAARLYAEQSDITRTLMRDLLPPRLDRVNGVEFAGGYQPAAARDRVGGDFYDVHPGSTPEDASLAVLGDVCGKGLDAAVLTGKIRNTLQALTPMAGDHEAMLRLLNGALLNSHHTRFATLVLASVRREENRVRLRLTSAGHPAPLVIRNDGRVEEIDTRGTLVGALPHIEARTVETELLPGETCLLYTDGVTEARGGPLGDELFGEERLMRAMRECAGMPGTAVVERVQMLASQWLHDGRHDDMALVAITAPPTTHLSAVNGHTRGRYTQ
ncbi:SpoIIE family protein phosphatase [Streptomyces sp. JH34]|uniref:SpoIIE family protein phosphatase n=1 Tax=Streptomyces sp. JH34 TaxID=2793633 RepID=UPI0023F61AEE|nr:SpoIIE family protein phosphatase [Streptomyces sp. JH34]MDF6020388.1 SpoIIE family protein phosphatase [Streptomyces sp. JH34]